MRPFKLLHLPTLVVFLFLGLIAGNCESQTSHVSAPLSVPSDGIDAQVNQIDALVKKVWDDYGMRPSRDATDAEWCRRVHLDIIGRIPTAQETTNFLAQRDEDKRKRLIDTLLYDDQYTEEFARNWTTVWTNLLIGRTGGSDQDSMISREGMQKFIRDSFAREKPYDKFVYELVTATGTTTPGDPNFNGATNFLIDKVNEEKASLATAATTKTFLGLQVQCTQCHNHPFNDWKQQKYWEMNAFFRQVRAYNSNGMRPRDGGIARLTDRDFRGENGKDPDKAEIFYELRNGLVSVAYPVFIDGQEINPHGGVNTVNRRKELAKLMIESPFFAKSMVNRTWAHFLGYGFTSPVDDLGPHNIPSNPELLDYLAQEFRSSEFDIRQLISWVALSKPYALSSRRTRANEKDDPLLGETPKFTHFYIRQMEAEQLYESLLIANESASQGSYEEQERNKNTWLRQFTTAFGTDEGQESTTFNGTIPQVLMMFNGDLIRKSTAVTKGTMINRLASSGNYNKAVEELFVKGLSRKPSGKEKDLAKSILSARSGNAGEALKDVWWVVLNTNEFIFNH